MTAKRISIDEKKARQVMDRLSGTAGEPVLPDISHISDEIIIQYVQEDLPEAEVQLVLAHIEICNECAAKLEGALSRQTVWAGPSGESRLEGLRRRLHPGLREHLRVVAARRQEQLQNLQRRLEQLVLNPGFLPSPGFLQAAMPAEVEGELDDHSLQWYYGPDDEGNLVIRISSFQLDYEGALIVLQAGEWQEEMLLEQVEPGQLGAELVIPADEVAAHPFERGIRFRLAV